MEFALLIYEWAGHIEICEFIFFDHFLNFKCSDHANCKFSWAIVHIIVEMTCEVGAVSVDEAAPTVSLTIGKLPFVYGTKQIHTTKAICLSIIIDLAIIVFIFSIVEYFGAICIL